MAREMNLPDRYSIISELGSGAIGSVYEAIDNVLNRKVAIKVIHQDKQFIDDHQILRFQREAKACGNLNSDALVTVYDFGVNNNREPYLVMELLEGTNLSDYIKKFGKLAPEKVFHIACRLANAMDYAHKHGVIHRDLKASNLVFLEAESGIDNIKVIDFGLVKFAKDADDKGYLTRANAIVGSPLYISPEQIEGVQVDGRADIYSLGCILFEALTGELPFQSDSLMELLMVKAHNNGPKPSTLIGIDSIPGSFDDLVAKCLKANPDERYASMEDLAKDLNLIDVSLFDTDETGLFGVDDRDTQSEKLPKNSGPIEMITIVALVIICSGLVVSFIDPFKIQEVSLHSKTALPETNFEEDRKKRKVDQSFIQYPHSMLVPRDISVIDGIRMVPLANDSFKAKVYGEVGEKGWSEILGKKVLRLHLNNCDLNDMNVPIILTLPVQDLELVDCTGPKSAFKQLAQSKTIQCLNFRRTSLEDSDLVPLKKLNLVELHFTHCPKLSEDALVTVRKQWPNLEILHLTGRRSENFSYKELLKLKKLDYLNVVITNEEQLRDIMQIKALKKLRISRSKLNRTLLKMLGEMKHLTLLQLDYCTNINKYDFDLLKHKLSRCQINVKIPATGSEMSLSDLPK